jgi:hypothetical protein
MVAMTLYRTHSIAPEKLLTLSINVLQQAFFSGPRLDAKRRYQFLENGRTIFLIKLRMEDGSELEVKLRMERSELRGKLNFSAFRQLLGRLLAAQVEQLHAGQPLNIFSNSEQQRWVYLIPALYQTGSETNMLVSALELSEPGALLMELMFIDPSQFDRQQHPQQHPQPHLQPQQAAAGD